jgi:hypothetical protein
LPEHDFDMPRRIVADIAIVEHVENENGARLRLEALLLDD